MAFSSKLTATAIILTMTLPLGACENKEGAGTILGAVGGAATGSAIASKGTGKVIAVAAGTLAGAYLGREVGKSLDPADRAAMQRSTQSALETSVSGTSSNWHNPDSGNKGTVTPQPAYKNADNQNCREYQQTVTVGGKIETAYGTACRQADGTWKIKNN